MLEIRGVALALQMQSLSRSSTMVSRANGKFETKATKVEHGQVGCVLKRTSQAPSLLSRVCLFSVHAVGFTPTHGCHYQISSRTIKFAGSRDKERNSRAVTNVSLILCALIN